MDAGRGRRRRGLRWRFGEATEQLGTLLQHRLAQPVDTAAKPRFRMLETIREFGLEALGTTDEAESVRRRHAEHYLALFEEAEPHVGSRV